MNLKIFGVGKCGSRIGYDFFAHIRGLPTSYEIRTEGPATVLGRVWDRVATETAFNAYIKTFRAQWDALTRAELLKDGARYTFVDSDLDNNEVAKQVELLDNEGRTNIFPGRSYKLAGQSGGCQYHVISENIATQWLTQAIPADVLDPEGAEVVAWAFSVGGGTGGGATPQLAAKSKAKRELQTHTAQVHYLGIGILPSSDQTYFANEPQPLMDGSEKYNAGRFFTSFLGKRNRKDKEPYFNSLWLVSNDLLRTLTIDEAMKTGFERQLASDSVVNTKELSLINTYVAQALCTLCNASSKGTISETDFDAREMNNSLDGSLFISAFAYGKPETGADVAIVMAGLQRLTENALCNVTVVDDQLQGLSAPVRNDDLRALRSILQKPIDTLKEFSQMLATYDPNAGPIEFRTASRVCVLFGQPEASTMSFRKQILGQIIKAVFPNATINMYPYRHPSANEYLLLLIVNPFCPMVVNWVFDYVTQTWRSAGSQGLMRDVIVDRPFKDDILEGMLRPDDESNHLPPTVVGEATLNFVKDCATPLSFKNETVRSAFATLHGSYHHEKPGGEIF